MQQDYGSDSEEEIKGLTKEEIEEMPVFIFNKENQNKKKDDGEIDDQSTCSICFNDFS